MIVRRENRETFEIEYWYVDDDRDELIQKYVHWERNKRRAEGTFAEECYKAVKNPYEAELVKKFGEEAWEDAQAWLD